MKNYNYDAEIIHIRNGDFGTNTYIIVSMISSKAIIIDPADGEAVDKVIKSNEIIPQMLINTHGHYDHISGNNILKENYNIPIYISAKDSEYLTDAGLNMSTYLAGEYISAKPDILLYEGKSIQMDNIELIVHATPGHTEGSIALSLGNMLFSGDLIFRDGIGRTDLPGGDMDAMINTLKTFYMKLKFDTIIFPGHGNHGTKNDFDIAVQQFFYTY